MALAHGGDHIGADGGCGQSELDLRQAKLGFLRRQRDVAGGDQAHAAGKGRPVHARDGRLFRHVDGVEHGGQRQGVGVVLPQAVAGHLFHPVQVGAGAERRAMTRQHHRAYALVRVCGLERLCQFRNHGFVEGVAHLRTVHPDHAYAVLCRKLQGFVFHRFILVSAGRSVRPARLDSIFTS